MGSEGEEHSFHFSDSRVCIDERSVKQGSGDIRSSASVNAEVCECCSVRCSVRDGVHCSGSVVQESGMKNALRAGIVPVFFGGFVSPDSFARCCADLKLLK